MSVSSSPATKGRGSKRPSRPNRIAELTRRAGLTYAQVAERCVPPTTEVTIARLSTGAIKLTYEWMQRLAVVFGVSPVDIVAPPISDRLRAVRVGSRATTGEWRTDHTLPPERQYDIMIPDNDDLRGVQLYAVELGDDSMNVRIRADSVLVCSRVANGQDLVPGRLYHVRLVRPDGESQELIRTLVQDDRGELWFRPESTLPQYQEWFPLMGKTGIKVEVLGRARHAVQRLD